MCAIHTRIILGLLQKFSECCLVLGDFNTPCVTDRQPDQRAIDAFTQHGLRHHVSTPTRGNLTSGNILDLVLSLDDQPNGQLVSNVTVQSVSFSDHHLVMCRLGVPPTPPVTTTYGYRPLRKIDVAAFSRDILSSRLYDSTVTDVDDYAELFDTEVRRVLDIHAPLRTDRVVVVDNMTFVSCLMKHAKPSSSAVAWNVDIGELVSSRIDERTRRHAQLRATV